MRLTRREWIGCGAASAGLMLLPGAARANVQRADLPAAVVERVRAFAAADLAGKGFPGMQIALVGPGGASATLAVGASELDGRTPAAPDQLFQIGSITKSLTALAVFVLAERGRIDLAARVQDLLPDLPLPPEPITVAHLLEHSSGLPNTLAPLEELSLPAGRLWTGFAPGSRYSYCNLGYALLGRIVARTSGMEFPQALQRLVLAPIGMTNALPAIRMRDRAQYAEGHVRFREDMPWLPGARLTEARWLEMEDAAGCVAATAPDMVAYVRAMLALASGKGAPLFSDAAATRFVTPTIDGDVPGRRYGNGLVHLMVDERPVLRHTGGMIGFSSSFTADPAAGVGAYASVNVGGAGGYRPNELTEYAVALLRAAAQGAPLPAERRPAEPPKPLQAEQVAGRWLSADGAEFTIEVQGERLQVAAGGVTRRLLAQGSALVTDHPALPPYLLAMPPGEIPALRLGSRLFGKDSAPPAPATPPGLAGLAGNYFNPGSWGSNRVAIQAVGDRLYIGNSAMAEAPDGSWRFVDPAGASERFWFERPLGGRAQRLNASGSVYTRLADG
jgi:CubicO group peptidase (beta-lactamase class C family)